jgi:hypothetical protein
MAEQRAFLSDELRQSWTGSRDYRRLAKLNRAWAALLAIESQGRRMSEWADSDCADRVAKPGHGRAA